MRPCHFDFVEAENSTGFQAPQEAARILGESINFSRQGQNTLRGNAQPAPRMQKASLRLKH
jgi:nitrite reductase (cytochrome c-552)